MRILLVLIFSLSLTACYDSDDSNANNHGYGYDYDWMSPTYLFKVRGDFVPESEYELIDFELWYERVNKCLQQENEPFPDLYIIFIDDLTIDGVEYAGYAHEWPPLILINRSLTEFDWDWYYPTVGQHEFAHILSGEFHHNGVVPICERYGQ